MLPGEESTNMQVNGNQSLVSSFFSIPVVIYSAFTQHCISNGLRNRPTDDMNEVTAIDRSGDMLNMVT